MQAPGLAYTCSRDALSTILSPEPDDPSIRAVALDSAAACNHSARIVGAEAITVLAIGAAVSSAWVVLRRQSRIDG